MPANPSIKTNLALIENDLTKVLGVKAGKHTITPGLFVPRADAQVAPELSYQAASPSATYLAIGVDLDAPFSSFAFLSPILHWIQAGLTADSNKILSSPDAPITNFVGAKPPLGSGPHRYVFMLYDQPADFDAKAFAPADGGEVGLMSRVRFDLDSWLQKAKLGPAVAVNYFTSN